MKDSLFEILMIFFEKSLAQLTENRLRDNNTVHTSSEVQEDNSSIESRTTLLKSAKNTSVRVFTYEEQRKLTKASHQFLIRLMRLEVIASETMEYIINQLLFSDSSYVTLEETKWTIRNTLAENLNENQLAFLDLILYQKKDVSLAH